MTSQRIHSPEWEIEHIVERIDAGESPTALSTSERIVASIIYDHPEWRPTPYTGLTAALDRLGPWRDALLGYCRIHGCRRWIR